MLADRKSEALAENFAAQWLERRGLAAAKPDLLKFPRWNAAPQEDMATEWRLFFDPILPENLGFRDNVTFLRCPAVRSDLPASRRG
jgi:hypothetical protein